MTVNSTVRYPAGSTDVSLVQLLRDHFVATLGWTVITDSTPGTASCIVAAQHAGLIAQSQAYIDIQVTGGNLWFIVQDSAGNAVAETDPSSGGHAHSVDLVHGGYVYIDGDDVGGEWIGVRSSTNSAINRTVHLVDLCSYESTEYLNFGVIVTVSSSSAKKLQFLGNQLYWVPPTGPSGVASSAATTHFDNGNAMALFSEGRGEVQNNTTGYNHPPTGVGLSSPGVPHGVQPYRLWVVESGQTNDSRLVGSRGVLKNIRGLDSGGHGFRAPYTDFAQSVKYMVYAMPEFEPFERTTFALPHA